MAQNERTKEMILFQTFIDSMFELDKGSKRIVLSSLAKFAENEKTSGIDLHRLERERCDKSFWGARFNKGIRAIVSIEGNRYSFLHVDQHDDSYSWAEGKYLQRTNFGAVYIYDELKFQEKYEDAEDALEDHMGVEQTKSRFEQLDIKSKDLINLGIPKFHADLMLRFPAHEETAFVEYVNVFPQELSEGLIDLWTGKKSMTQVYAELQENQAKANQNSTELHPDEQRRSYKLSSPKDLEDFDRYFDEDQHTTIDDWKLYLHPNQMKIVKINANGPVLVEGGPGTGKTIVAIHRALYLNEHYYGDDDYNILFLAFSRKLAALIENELLELAVLKGINRSIAVRGVDQFLLGIVRQYRLLTLSQTDLARNHLDSQKLFQRLYIEQMDDVHLQGLNFAFLYNEYKNLIEKYQIKTLEQYLDVSRKGMRISLDRKKREAIWQFFDSFLKEKERQNLIDFEDCAKAVIDAVERGMRLPKYNSIIIDEAQDLSPTKIRAISLLVKDQPNHLMMFSDRNQRIFQMTSWKRDTELNIVGNTYHLRVNYRTTRQIREHADLQFRMTEIEKGHIKDYISLRNGAHPEFLQFHTLQEQQQFVYKKIRKLLKNGLQPHQIGILAYSAEHSDVAGLFDLLMVDGIAYTILKDMQYPRPGVGVCFSSVDGCKGLSFEVVFFMNYTAFDRHYLNVDKRLGTDFMEILKNQIECKKYVACTRSRQQLFVTDYNNR